MVCVPWMLVVKPVVVYRSLSEKKKEEVNRILSANEDFNREVYFGTKIR